MLSYAKYTDLGNREVNEDAIFCNTRDDKSLFLLCDGLGGHGLGDVASQVTVETFDRFFSHTDDVVNFLGSAFVASQEALIAKQKEMNLRNKMRTTAVAICADKTTAYIGHIGDSRLYIFAKNKVKTRTIDHSIPQMLALSKQIKESEIRNHPDRNILLRALGDEWEENMYELMAPISLKKCQAFLLCSDGFWELIEEQEMCSLLKSSSSVEEWLTKMVKVVKTNGIGRKMDNNSAIAIWNG